ncbi:acyl transferase [Aureivirga sp. CE67]|uniref:LuxE/PaaK family acyltransferase n=1 Tax=Aureivirga sp. CE67 TaxID=1788983 RepID=UPI0018CBB046|nr:acyl transferase [Aureivirga sp. CE67]
MKNRIFDIKTEEEFNNAALDVFRFQVKNNEVYGRFVKYLGINPEEIKEIEKIPFLPIQFFKTEKILSTTDTVKQIFLSSGTTGSVQSQHLVTDLGLYEQSYLKAFEQFYGNIEDYTVLALLPSYLEREGSSLIYMVNDLINKSKNSKSGFYLHNLEELKNTLNELDISGEKVLLIGVSFALLDLIEEYNFQLKNTIVMETGGMKGKRKEMIRTELHEVLKKGFGLSEIHSEYGMTELLSQAYSKGHGIFETPSWMKILIRNTEDPFEIFPLKKAGGINVIDLANINSCSFIATQDLGKKMDANLFEILGRFDNSDIRGCNLLIQ